MPKPDYNNSIVNLMAAIGRSLGYKNSLYEPPACLDVSLLERRSILLVVVDGMGYDFLKSFPESFLGSRLAGRLSSVFPSTTASAITSFATGTAPQQHGITGWYMYAPELGNVATILRFHPRGGGESYVRSGIAVSDIIAAPPLADRLAGPMQFLSPCEIVDSDYTRGLAGGAKRCGYNDLGDFFSRLRFFVRHGEYRLVFAYWPMLDSLAHAHGIASGEARAHFLALDECFRSLAAELEGSDAAVLVTADHGLIDTDAGHTVHLEDIPKLSDLLLRPLCGDPRQPFCYVVPGRQREFAAIVHSELGHCCEIVESGELISMGYFGQGRPHPSLAARVGDYALLMRPPFVLCDRVPGEEGFSSIGVHGGLSRAEMEVPLIVL